MSSTDPSDYVDPQGKLDRAGLDNLAAAYSTTGTSPLGQLGHLTIDERSRVIDTWSAIEQNKTNNS